MKISSTLELATHISRNSLGVGRKILYMRFSLCLRIFLIQEFVSICLWFILTSNWICFFMDLVYKLWVSVRNKGKVFLQIKASFWNVTSRNLLAVSIVFGIFSLIYSFIFLLLIGSVNLVTRILRLASWW